MNGLSVNGSLGNFQIGNALQCLAGGGRLLLHRVSDGGDINAVRDSICDALLLLLRQLRVRQCRPGGGRCLVRCLFIGLVGQVGGNAVQRALYIGDSGLDGGNVLLRVFGKILPLGEGSVNAA